MADNKEKEITCEILVRDYNTLDLVNLLEPMSSINLQIKQFTRIYNGVAGSLVDTIYSIKAKITITNYLRLMRDMYVDISKLPTYTQQIWASTVFVYANDYMFEVNGKLYTREQLLKMSFEVNPPVLLDEEEQQ